MHFNGIWNDMFGVGSAKKMFKPRMLNGAFWLNLNRWFGSWNCQESFESKDAKWCIHTLLEASNEKLLIVFHMSIFKQLKTRTINGTFWRCLKTKTINGTFWRCLKTRTINGTFWSCLKTRTVNGTFWRCLKRYLELYKAIVWNCRC